MADLVMTADVPKGWLCGTSWRERHALVGAFMRCRVQKIWDKEENRLDYQMSKLDPTVISEKDRFISIKF
jgi:hypothetical protein